MRKRNKIICIALIFTLIEVGCHDFAYGLRVPIGSVRDREKTVLEAISINSETLPCKTLYKLERMSGETKLSYSRLKLGNIKVIETFAEELYGMINKEFGEEISNNPDEWILVSGPYLGVRNSAFYIGNYIERKLQIQRVHISRNPYFSKNVLYIEAPDYVKARIAKESLFYEGNISLTGKKAIFVDDCIASGTISKAVRDILLDKGVSQVMPYAVVEIENPIVNPEITLDKAAITENGVDEILDILKMPEHVITSRLITFISGLEMEEIRYLIGNLEGNTLHELKKAIVDYYSYEYPPDLLCKLFDINTDKHEFKKEFPNRGTRCDF